LILVRFFLPTSIAENLKNIEKQTVFIGFRENWPFEVSVDFSMNLMPSWLRFGSKKPLKIDQNTIKK